MLRTCVGCLKEWTTSDRHKFCGTCRYQKEGTVSCPTCGQRMTTRSKVCAKCVPRTGENNGSWKGGKSYHRKGYVLVRNPSHPRAKSNSGYVLEHILVMEEFLGRYLAEGEQVHHLNGIKDDNRLENLELWIGVHPSGVRVEDSVDHALKVLREFYPCALTNEYK